MRGQYFQYFSHSSVQFSIVVMTWHDFTSYSIVFINVNFRSGFPTLAYIFRCIFFPLLIKQHIRMLIFWIFLLGTQWLWSFYTLILNLSIATNFQYGHCVYVYFNTLNLLYGVILYKCTLCNLVTSAKTFACLSINIEVYFWYFVILTECIVFVPLLLRL